MAKVVIPKGGMLCRMCGHIGNFIYCPECGFVNTKDDALTPDKKLAWIKKVEDGLKSSTETM